MKDTYNDYQNTVRNYLRDYNYFKIVIANLKEDKRDCENILQSNSVSIARYGDATGGGGSELNQTEAAAATREKLKARLRRVEDDLHELCSVVNRIDRAIAAVGKIERKAIAGYYFDKRSWDEVGIELDCTGKTARAKANRGIDDMAFMIFGQAARPRQLSFCFIKSLPVDNFG